MRRKRKKLTTRMHVRLREDAAKVKKLAKDKEFWFKTIMLLILVAVAVWASSCGGKTYNYHPKTVIFKSGENGAIQACRIQTNGTTICEYDLEYFKRSTKDDTFYGFPSSMYKKAGE